MDSVATSRQFSVKHQPDLNFSRIEGDGIPRGSQQLSGIRQLTKAPPTHTRNVEASSDTFTKPYPARRCRAHSRVRRIGGNDELARAALHTRIERERLTTRG